MLLAAGLAAPALVDRAWAESEPVVDPKLQRQFGQWLAREMWPRAQRAGVPRRLFQRALGGVELNIRLPDLVPPGAKRVPRRQRQAEFSAPAKYFNERSLRVLARQGRALRKKHARLLRRIEKRFGVPGGIVLAIWARESNYGRAAIRHDAFEILATQAFMGRRKKLFQRELIAALMMVARGHVSLKDMKSSWAGALGQPQFMPSDYLRLAVDFDGDGRRDIWRSVPDVLASIANHLRHNGWRAGVRWGVEARVPASVSCTWEGPDQGRAPSWWEGKGLARISGQRLPADMRRQKIYLMMPAGRYGPGFAVSRNFYVIKSYNMSDLYALFVGHLGDRIEGRADGPFKTRWGNVGHLLRSDVAYIQRRLERLGHDVGGADGLPGFKTRRSIGRHELKNGLPEGCFPTEKLLRFMKRG